MTGGISPMDWCFLLLVAFVPTDVGLAVVFLGFFQPGWTFDGATIERILLLADPYEFWRTPLEFGLLAACRAVCLAGIALLHVMKCPKTQAASFMPLVLLTVVSYSCSLIKLLAMSENLNQLQFPGFWLSTAWSIFASGVLGALTYVFLGRKTMPEYDRLKEKAEEETSEKSAIPQQPTKDGTWKYVTKLLAYCKKEWKWFTVGFVALLIYALARVFIPSMMGDVISDIVERRGYAQLLRSIFKLGSLSVLASIVSGLRGGAFDYGTAKVSRQVRSDLFRSLVRQDIAFFDVTKSGDMVSRLTSDCEKIATSVPTNLNVFLRNGVMLIGALCYMFALSWRLAMVTFIAIPLIGLITKWYGAFFDRISERMQETISKANHVAEEVLSTMRTVRSFACETRESRRFNDHLTTTLGISRKRAVAYTGYTWTNELCENVILVSVLFYGGSLVMKGLMTSDEMIKFLLYQLQLGENLQGISYVFSGLMESVGASRKVFEYMHRKPAMPLDGGQKPARVQGQIIFDNVYFTYPSRLNNPVLQGLNLTIPAGKTVALVGPSGGGKSSIVALIEHFYEPDKGSITLDGVPIKDINHIFYHHKIALVAQEPILYDGSVRHNILYGCDWATEEDMLRAAEMANVHDFVREQEKGYDTACGEKGVQMSGGQKQRIAIARALVRRPAVLILDEATSALDAESEHLVQEALNKCARERTVLIIAHRLSTIEKADQIAVIQKGRVIQMGNHLELMEEPDGLYHSLVARQLLAVRAGRPEDSNSFSCD